MEMAYTIRSSEAMASSIRFYIILSSSSFFVLPCNSYHDYEREVPPQVSPDVYSHSHSDYGSEEDTSELLNWDTDHIGREKDHIQEHMDLPTMDVSNMTGEELQFHYFKIHDVDKDNRLDGCELIKSIIHAQEHDHQKPNESEPTTTPRSEERHYEQKIWRDEELAGVIDPIIAKHDLNGDGMIDYSEFKLTLHKR